MIERWQLTFDCADPKRLGKFYGAALHYEDDKVPDGFATMEEWLKSAGVPEEEWGDAWAIVDPKGVRPRIWFHKMGTPKPEKNRLHLDMYVEIKRPATLAERKARVDPEVERVVALGATVQERVEEGDYYFVTCLDPEGNEFDVA